MPRGAVRPKGQAGLRLAILLTLASLPLGCGGGGGRPSTPNSPLPATPSPPTGPVAVTVLDGEGVPPAGLALRVDGVLRSPRTPGSGVFDLDRSLVNHALDLEADGFLVHQAFVPDRDRTLDLFIVPRDGSKAWIKNLLYDGVINTSGTLARLTQPVSLLRGNTITPEQWESVRGVLTEAADRVGGVTGYPFRLADAPVAGTVPYTFDLDPSLAFGAYFAWTGNGNVIQRATVEFRTLDRMRDFSLVLHELTHGFGLSHSDRTSDVMHPTAVSDTHSERELSVIASVKRRPPGTAYEDNVRSANAAAGLGPTSGSTGCSTR